MSLVAHGIVAAIPMKAALKGLAHELAEYHNKDTGLCCPSLDRLAHNLCCDVRSVQRYLKELEAAGVVTREERFVEGRQTTSNYVFMAQNLSPRPGAAVTPEGDAAVAPEGDRAVTQNQKKEPEVRTERRAKAFVPPTLSEVRAYVREKRLPIDPATFHAYFEAGDWHDGNGKPVRNWKQKAITWGSKSGPRAADDDRRHDGGML